MKTNTELTDLIGRFTRLLSFMEDEVLSHKELSSLTMKQLNYLDLIRAIENPKVGDLVKHLSVAKPTVTITLQNLMDQGYIKKSQSADDKRIINIELTPKGKKINRIHDNAHRRIVRQIFECLNEKEVGQLARHVRKILEQSELKK